VTTDRPDTRRARILAVARKHFGLYGYRRAVLDDIAAEAGCAKGSLYLEFPGKQALYFAVMDDVQAEVGGRFRAAIDGVTSPAEWLRISVRFTFDTLEREPLLARLLRDDPDLPALREYAAQDRVRAEAEAALQQFRALLERGIAAGELRRDLDLEVLPFVLSSLKFLHLHADHATAGMIDRRRYFDGVADFALSGLLVPKESAS
jgi:AcrR family transcriptional regulator